MKAAGGGQKAEGVLLASLTFAVILAFWHIAVIASRTTIFPSPLSVGRAIASLAEHKLLWSYIGDSLFRVAMGYAAAAFVGVPLGVVLGYVPPAARAINPLIQILRPISPLAWMPLAVIWFGVSNAAPIFLIFLASLFPIVVGTMNGVHAV